MNMSSPETIAPTGYLVRHGVMRHMGEFTPLNGEIFVRNDDIIIRSERGLEVAQVICQSTPPMMAALPEPTTGTIVRTMTPEDHIRQQGFRDRRSQQYDTGAELIRRHSLPMQLVDVEPLFSGERIVFYFLADKRVDFRELVKSMARDFQSRIELRQIGVRDEAKLLADYGDCGRPVCCNTHMVVMPPVSMRMAKLQKSTLDPSKISGRCGRLKCCLRFEQDVYEEFQAELPSINARILTRKGQGRVLAHEILARSVMVEFEDGRRLPVHVDEILTKMD